jgi:hypothetical protein
MSVWLGDRKFKSCFGNKEASQFHFWEYTKGNLAFILDSHRPFICSVYISGQHTVLVQSSIDRGNITFGRMSPLAGKRYGLASYNYAAWSSTHNKWGSRALFCNTI